MSFCPNNDIHSVYLDNELPDQFKAEYEAHVNSCPKCQAELAKLRGLRSIFAQDSAAITPDSHYLDESFARLQIKMGYSKTTSHNVKNKQFFAPKNISYISMAAAAAVIFAFIIPLRIAGVNKAGGVVNPPASGATVASSTISPIPYSSMVNNVAFDSGKNGMISSRMNGPILSSVSTASNVNGNAGILAGSGRSSYYGRNVSKEMMKNIEVFRPNLREDEVISIRITIPGMEKGSVSSDFSIPVTVVAGRFE